MKKIVQRYIGDKQFYKMVLTITLPILLQNGITNFVSLLDNIMVGQLGTVQMSGVSIVNQLIFVFNICIFGGVAGPSIYGAQFYGQGNHKGVRDTFRFKLMVCLGMGLLGIGVLYFGGSDLIHLYLNDTVASDVALTHAAGMSYLMVMLIGLLPYTISQVYASTLRETGETFFPMLAGVIAVGVNLIFNWLLIFGMLGFPKLGVVGAAVATVMSRFVEMGIIVIRTHRKRDVHIFIQGAYKSLAVPGELIRGIVKKGSPLLINEVLWAAGQAFLTQCYSLRGLNAVAALNISRTVSDLFNTVFYSLGAAIAIVIGQYLGAGEKEKAVDTDRKMISFSVLCCLAIGTVMFILAPLFPAIYNTTEQVRQIATYLLRIAAVFMPVYAFYHAAYFTLRTGGKTIITFLFDSGYIWVVDLPIALLLSHLTGWPVVWIYLSCQCAEIAKVVVGAILLKKRVWVNNIVEKL